MVGGLLSCVFILHSSVCAASDHASLAQLISISLFMGGLCTILQVTVGVRYDPVLLFSVLAFAASWLLLCTLKQCPVRFTDVHISMTDNLTLVLT